MKRLEHLVSIFVDKKIRVCFAGINAYFAYTVVGFRGTGLIKYEQALAAVFIEV